MKSKAYAKINLGLKVLGKRDDGYHNLEMVMVNINLYDQIEAHISDNIEVKCDKDVCKMEDNLVYKTATLIKDKYYIDKGVCFYIKKMFPDGGGLGGGSSDAATAIRMLDKLWKIGLSMKEMEEIALEIGSDVCFFLYNRLSVVKGRGERVIPINKKIKENVILVIPNFKCSTKKVFDNWNSESTHDIQTIVNNINGNYYDYMFNDLECATSNAYADYPLERIKKSLSLISPKCVLMSGSGATVFAIGYKMSKNAFKEIKAALNDCIILKCKTISCCKKG